MTLPLHSPRFDYTTAYAMPSQAPGLMPDWMIRERLELPEDSPWRLRLYPFDAGTSRPGLISSGLTSYGYDFRLDNEYLIFGNPDGLVSAWGHEVLDPLTAAMQIERLVEDKIFTRHIGRDCVIEPNSFVLARTVEWVRVPEDVMIVMLCKSTYARIGVNLNMTPLEPGWEGVVTIEIANTSGKPVRVHSLQGIGQGLFFCGAAPCEKPYHRKKDPKYQGQTGITLPRA